MGVKYYTHFVLTSAEASDGRDQEFSGVVEVNQTTERYQTKDIEALLARNFDLASNEVRLINWARLH